MTRRKIHMYITKPIKSSANNTPHENISDEEVVALIKKQKRT
jgi:hypothetical protein